MSKQEATDGAAQRSWPIVLPVLPPATALVELVVLFSLIIGVDWLLPGLDVMQVQPHPFWLPVLVLSLQYGTVSGLLAAASAIVLTAILGFPEQDIGENLFNYLVRVWAQPILWIAVAVLLGQFRMRQIEDKRDLAETVKELVSQRDAIDSYARRLRRRCDELERYVSGRVITSSATVVAALGREAAATDDLGDAFRRDFEALFPGGLGVLLDVRGTVPSTLAVAGRDPDLHAASDHGLAAGHPLLVAVCDQRRILTIASRADEQLLASHALAAAPIEGAQGEPIGVVLIRRLDPVQLRGSIVEPLRVLARLQAASLARGSAVARPERTFGAEAELPVTAAWARTSWHTGSAGGHVAASAAPTNATDTGSGQR